MKIKTPVALAALFAALTVSSSEMSAAEFSSVGNFGFLGGQYLYAGAPSSLSGNLSLGFSPSVKFSGSATGILTYSGSYRGAKEVAQLAGGGTLFQDAQSHVGSLKIVLSPSKKIKIRPLVSYRKELLRETLGEQWTKGLFDYDKISAGAEAECEFSKKHSAAVGADYFTLAFPNYVSLESRQTADLGREQAGAKTLDSANLMISARSSHAFGRKLKLRLDAASVAKNYPDQPVATSLDALSATQKRADAAIASAASVSFPFSFSRDVGLIVEPGYSYSSLDSNQNRADARKARFIADYYDYNQGAPSANLHFIFGKKPAVVTLGGSLSSRNYSSRPVQNADGDYLTDKIYVNETLSTLAAAYPVAKDLKARASVSHLKSESNMEYESVYKYNFESSAYFIGFNFDF
ncbi:MAG: hypothetical protein QME32_03575 [Endomicrobiia bacterium]|nr:hypothetical protein [Endomicrobiia bacterium]